MSRSSWKMILCAGVLMLTSAAGSMVAGGAGAAPDSRAAWTGGAGPTVAIQTFQFRPASIVIEAGTRLTWRNHDDIVHTVTSGAPEHRDGRFTGPLEGQGAVFVQTFSQAGLYPYFCDRHQSMRGEIVVRSPGKERYASHTRSDP
jgi:plastocyanin